MYNSSDMRDGADKILSPLVISKFCRGCELRKLLEFGKISKFLWNFKIYNSNGIINFYKILKKFKD